MKEKKRRRLSETRHDFILDNYNIIAEDSKVCIVVNAPKRWLARLYLLGAALLLLMVIIMVIYFKQEWWYESPLAGFIGISVFIFLFLLALDGLFFLCFGYEKIIFDKKIKKGLIYRKGLFAFSKKKFYLSEIRDVKSSGCSNSSVNAIFFGYGGGKIKVVIKEKEYEIGASLSMSEAEHIVNVLKTFLKCESG